MILTQQLILGLLVGGLYGLAAAGLSLTFGVLRVLNVAHGELLMLGGYGAFWLFTLWRIDPFVSLLAIGPAMFVLGLLLYWALFQFVVKAHEEVRIKNSLLIGFGLTLVLHNLAIRLWTADERAVTTAYAGAVARIGALAIPLVRLTVSCWRLLFWRCCTYFLRERAGAVRFARQPKIGRLRPLWEFQWGKLICWLLPLEPRWRASQADSSAFPIRSVHPSVSNGL